MRHELRNIALEALDRLPPDYRRVLRYSLQEHLTVKQMAERLGRSENAVKKLHGRAIVRFREALQCLRDETHA
jgi:RNA polymerase sigma factor (sigma-70 family)